MVLFMKILSRLKLLLHSSAIVKIEKEGKRLDHSQKMKLESKHVIK